MATAGTSRSPASRYLVSREPARVRDEFLRWVWFFLYIRLLSSC